MSRYKKRKKYKVSKAEREILVMLEERGYEVIPQFRIEGIPYIYDFYFPKLNKILEYQGDYYHCNPNKYKSGSLIRMAGLGTVYVDYIWDKDQLKQMSAIKQGFKLITVWEEDYKKYGWNAIEKSLKF